MAGVLVISLDFELFWGVRDRCALADVAPALRASRRVIPQMLALFDAYRVRATWATVGFLFFESRSSLLNGLPRLRPDYRQSKYSPYAALGTIGAGEEDDPYHYGLSLIEEIDRHPGQEIGTHTFSHYFALEDGQTVEAFEQDLVAAASAARRVGRPVRSLVFPRNQCNDAYLAACGQAGIVAYRGNPKSWIYRARPRREESRLLRAFRLLDAYVNLSGHHTYAAPERTQALLDVPASRFLRPWSPRLRWLEALRLRRIKRSMTRAAQRGEVFHLWWHPENFGEYCEENLGVLRKILSHYRVLEKRYGMVSRNMGDFGQDRSARSFASVA